VKLPKEIVLLVTADEGDNPIALGSGFFVQSNVIATAYHVIKFAPQIYAKIVGRRGRHKITLIDPDGKNDLVLLRIDDVKGRSLRLGNLARLRVGDDIYVMGNPEGLEGTFSRGNISAIRNGGGLIQITAPISHGSSGGPVLDDRGEVIGIAVGILTEGQNLNFAVPVSKLAPLLKHDVTQYLDPELLAAGFPEPNEPVPEWQFVSSGDSEEHYMSRARVSRTPERTFLAWIKSVPNDSPEGRALRKKIVDLLSAESVDRSSAFSYSMNQWEFDCSHRKMRNLHTTFYDREGGLLYDADLSNVSGWQPALPDSVSEGYMNFVCTDKE
jgi:Trypsin-like peptidase domain